MVQFTVYSTVLALFAVYACLPKACINISSTAVVIFPKITYSNQVLMQAEE